jgi:hypothetical protein
MEGRANLTLIKSKTCLVFAAFNRACPLSTWHLSFYLVHSTSSIGYSGLSVRLMTRCQMVIIFTEFYRLDMQVDVLLVYRGTKLVLRKECYRFFFLTKSKNFITGRVSNYETFRLQTNPYDPKPWETVKRFDSSIHFHSHFNKYFDK